ncbi:MAG TPA: beta-ketoacyl-ACP synthase III [Candidatus Eisenbacteria bacterium]|nr:beta-ketoacyl-ACP synthase III [Candidatus Eisenbacteria bacterium]
MPAPKSAIIRGIGAYYPERVLTNSDLEKMVDTSDEWIRTRTGIRERRLADATMASSDLAYRAAMAALEKAGRTPKDIDLIMVATVTPDYVFPSCACTLQAKLRAPQAAAFDLNAACTGFIYGLALARSMLLAEQARCILLVGVETLSRIVDYEDRSTCILFGDAAGAAIVEGFPEPGRGILSVAIGSDGDQGDLLCLPAGGSKQPASHETVDARLHYMHMAGNEVFKIAVRGMETIARQAMDMAGAKVEDIDLLIPHQANTRIIDATAKRLGIPREKVVVVIDRFGNTSASSIPLALSIAEEEGRVHRGDLLGMVAFGGGLTWGASVVRWETGA